ncbi:MAG TPA: hypothetical protein VF302_10410 [Candidatus Limnocylindrales bacterium]
MNSSTDTRPHGDNALAQAIEPKPSGRFGLHAFTIRQPPKREPFVPKPLVRRTPRLRPVDGVTEALAPHKRTAPLPTRTTLDAAAPMHGIAVDAPGKAIAPEAVTRPRGAEAIIGYLRGRGVELSLSTDGAHVLPRSLAGRMFSNDRALLDRAGPLLVAYLAGAPLRCMAGKHDNGVADTAVTIAVGGCPMCAYHAAGGAS